MKTLALWGGWMFSCLVQAQSLFEPKAMDGVLERMIVERGLSDAKNVKNMKVVSINEELLREGAVIEVGVFKSMSRQFTLRAEEGGALWKAKASPFEWVLLRKMGRSYSGVALLDGKQYALVPVEAELFAIREVSTRNACGMSGRVGEAQSNGVK